MNLPYDAKRLQDIGRALKGPRAQSVDALLAHAATTSPYYRATLVHDAPLHAQPTLDKATMMERFDQIVTDDRLKRDDLLDHLDGLDHDALYLGEYRAMTTSGSSGMKGLYVYDRRGWASILALFLRCTAEAGIKPRLPRVKIAAIGGGAPTHMSRRGAQAIAIGIHRVLPLSVTTPIDTLVRALNAFQPDYLNVFPSIGVLLAAEQLEGRLRISPRVVSTSSELRTPEMTERMTEAFKTRPYDIYATTEGLFGISCAHGGGIHLFEDAAVAENVDAHGRPVRDGEPGARLLVTNLVNRVQPLIRVEVSDVMTLASEPCPCGSPRRKVTRVDGRADDVIRLDGVDIHPLQFGVVTADRDVREFQVVQEGETLRLRVVLRDPAAGQRLRSKLATRLDLAEERIVIERCERLERPPGGKLQMVLAARM
jgi:phenylacetate-coenzyme A ligase PaaK-like adenylate-forming protein